MFGVDWSNPETFWLNATNLMLGLVTLACAGALIYGLAGDLLARTRQKMTVSGLGRDLQDLHSLQVPELGLTMADGGEPVEDPSGRQAKPAKDPQK